MRTTVFDNPLFQASEPVQHSLTVALPVANSMSGKYLDSLLPVGSTVGTSTTKGQLWGGSRGIAYLIWKGEAQQGKLTEAVDEDGRVKKEEHAGDMIKHLIRTHVMPNAGCMGILEELQQGFADYVMLAELGYFVPAVLPEPVLRVIKRQHPSLPNLVQIINEHMQSKYTPIANAAANTEAYLDVQHISRIPEILTLKLTPADFREELRLLGLQGAPANSGVQTQTQTAVAPAGANAQAAAVGATVATTAEDEEEEEDPAAGAATATNAAAAVPAAAPAAAAAAPDPATAFAEALVKAMKAANKKEPTTKPSCIRVTTSKGERYTPHGAVWIQFWISMDTLFGLAGQPEKDKLFSYHITGAQGKLHVLEFAQNIQMLYETVRHMQGIDHNTPIDVFLAGLNSKDSAAMARTYRHSHPGITLADLAREVQTFEDDLMHEKQTALQASISQGATGTRAMRGVASADRKLRSQDPAVQDMLRRCSEKTRESLMAAVKLADTDPNHPMALCKVCPPSAKHINSACRSRNREDKQDAGDHAMALYQSVSGGGVGLGDLGSSAAAGSSAQGFGAAGDMVPASDVLNIFKEMMAMAFQQGIPRGEVKPSMSARRGGYSAGHSSASAAGCTLCGFERAHECWCEKPEKAPEDWQGPSRSTLNRGVLTYIRACMRQNLVPKLHRCEKQVEALQRSGQLKPQELDKVRSVQQRRQAVAAAAYHDYQPYMHAAMSHAAPAPAVGSYNAPQMQFGVTQQSLAQQNVPSSAAPVQQPSSSAAANAPATGMMAWQGGGFAMAAYASPCSMLATAEPLSAALPAAAAAEFPTPCSVESHALAVNTRSKGKVKWVDEVDKQQAGSSSEPAVGVPEAKEEAVKSRRALPSSFLPPPQTPRRPVRNTPAAAVDTSSSQPPAASAKPAQDSNFTMADHQQLVDCINKVLDRLPCITGYLTTEDVHAAALGEVYYDAQQDFSPGILEVGTKRLFQFNLPDYNQVTSSRQTLDLIATDGLTVGIYMRREGQLDEPVEGAMVDSGSNTFLLTEYYANRKGIRIYRDVPLPALRAIDGKVSSYLLGRTEPLTFILGRETKHPAYIHLPHGAYVIKGNAGGMYNVCVDKQSLAPIFGHVHPVYRHLVWYPNAARGDFSVMNGVPVSSFMPAPLSGPPTLGSASMTALAADTAVSMMCMHQPMEGNEHCSSSCSSACCAPHAAVSSACAATAAAAAPAEHAGTDCGHGPEAKVEAATPAPKGNLLRFMMLQLLLLLTGFFNTVDFLLLRTPSRWINWLVNKALCPVWMRYVPATAAGPPRAVAGCGQPGQESATTRCGKRPRKKGNWTKRFLHSWHKQQQKVVKASKLAVYPGSLVARCALFLLLLCLASLSTTAAMQASQGLQSVAASTAVQPDYSAYDFGYDLQRYGPNELLAAQLNQLPLGFFAAAAEASEPDTAWYNPTHTVLEHLEPDGTPEDTHSSNWTVHPEGQWIIGNHPDLTAKDLEALTNLLMEEKGAFAYTLEELPGYAGDPLTFQLIDPDKRMWSPQRHFTEDELAFGDAKVKEMLQAGVVEEIATTNPHASAVTLPMKRAPDGSWSDKRWCVDLRKVNSNTVVDKHGVPLPEDLFRRMRGAKFFSKIDLRSGFWQLRLSQEAKQQMAFWWRNKLYTFNRLPFGHVNATAVFQRAMECELQRAGLTHTACVFVDDVCIFSDTIEEHMTSLRQLLQHFQKCGLRAHPAKSIIAADCIPYLGHLLSANDLRPEPAKIAAMQALKPPTSVKQLQAHLGLFNYYRCYVPNFSLLAQPLYALLKKEVAFHWGPEQQQAYDSIKGALSTPGLALQQPRADRPFHLYVDWSNTGIAAVLNQVDEQGNECLVACASRSLNSSEKNYPAWKGEMLAAVWGVKLFRPYLHSRQFYLHTDHRALLWLLTHKEPVGQQMRWCLALQDYRFTLVHKEGINNPADAPSREPVSCSADITGARLDTAYDAWPLPKVLQADMSQDNTAYTHDSLTQLLGITPKGAKKSGSKVSPAAALAWQADSIQPTLAQLRHDLLHCVVSSTDAVIDSIAPTPASMLGGGGV